MTDIKNIKYLLIPDVHGRSFWKEPVTVVLNGSDDSKVIFMGDYTDPYPSEFDPVTNKSIEKTDGYESLKDVIKLKKEYPDRVILLLGNHDLGYIYDCICNTPRRKDFTNKAEIRKLILDNINLFALSHVCEFPEKKYLVSHAGVTTDWVNEIEELLKTYIEDFKFTPELYNRIFRTQFGTDNDSTLVATLSYCSIFRGGEDNCSSIVWAEIGDHLKDNASEWAEKNGYTQVFGHTMLSQYPISFDGKSFLIDVKNAFTIDSDGNLDVYGDEWNGKDYWVTFKKEDMPKLRFTRMNMLYGYMM